MIEAFPLQWPQGYPRTPHFRLKKSQFQTTLGRSRDDVMYEISRLGGTNPIISTNIPVRKDGMLYATQKPVDNDLGVAIYFTWKDAQYVIACDRYTVLSDNLRAVAKTIEAMRGIERWGCSDILNRTFSGLKQLPQQGSGMAWYDVLQVKADSSIEAIKSNYKSLVKEYHPDNQKTGSPEKFHTLNEAYRQALAAKGESRS